MEGGKQRFRFHFGEDFAPFGQHAFDNQTCAFDVGLVERTQRRRCLLQQQLVLVERGDIAECTHRRFGCAETGDAGIVQNMACFRHRSIAHPARNQRFADTLFRFGHSARHFGGVAADFGRINRQHAVDFFIVFGLVDGGAVMFGRCIFAQINQINQRCQRRHLRFQFRYRFG